MAKQMTKAELEKRGAKLIKSAPKKETIQPQEKERLKKSVEKIAGGIGDLGTLAEQIVVALRENEGRSKPIAYEFILERDKRGLLERVRLIPEE